MMSVDPGECGPWGAAASEPITRTVNPSCTVGSMIALKFDGGVAVLADRVTSYGKSARYTNTPRIVQIGAETLLAVGGDVADFQLIQKRIELIAMERACRNAGADFPAPELHSWLSAVLYNRRSRMNPLWLSALVAGKDGNDAFLGEVNLRGVPNSGDYIATGFGTYLCRQKLNTAFEAAAAGGRGLTEAEAVQLLRDCQTVLFYRDCTAYPVFDIGIVGKDGARIISNESIVETSQWKDQAAMTRGYE